MELTTPALKISIVLSSALLLWPVCLRAQTVENRSAKYFEIGKTDEAPLFTQHIRIETSPSGEKNWSSEIQDAAGAVIIAEKALIRDNKVVSQTVDNSQAHESYDLQIGLEKAEYRTFRFNDAKRGELIEEASRSKEDTFVTGPSVEFYLSQQWEKLSSGATVKVQFGIVEILRSIGFELKSEGENEKILRLKMKPSNFFISLLVDPIHLEFDKATKHLIRYKGRTPLRKMRDGKLKPWDAEVVYE